MKKEMDEPKNKKSAFTAIVLVLILINSFIGLIVISSGGSSSDAAPALEELEEQIADLSRQLSGLNLRLQIMQMQQNASQFKIVNIIKDIFEKVIEWVK